MLVEPGLTKLHKEILEILKPYVETPLRDYYELRRMLGSRYSLDELSDVLFELDRDGMVEFDSLSNGLFQIRLTHKGLNYRLLLRKAAWKKWKDRIWGFLIGVVTGVTSTIIIQQISLWLSK